MAQQIIIKGTPVVAANEVLVADSNSKIPAVDGSAVTAIAGGNITGTIPTARLDTGTTANKLVVLGGSGLPAVDGSLLTGIVSYTKSASDPTISTNPSGGVGTEWVNHTTGKQFICTDATAGENVWKCSGGGSGSVSPFHFTNASLYCFAPGGNSGGDTNQLHIDKVTFASDGNSTDQGDMTWKRRGKSQSTSTTHGYSAGGYGQTPPSTGQTNRIDKFAMVTESNSTDVGDLSVAGETHAGCTSETYGYAAGGGAGLARVDRYAFASDGNATNLGNLLSVNRNYPMGGSTQTHGYILGSSTGSPTNQIEKFSFADDSTTADVGDLVGSKVGSSSHCEVGYIWAAGHNSVATNRIDKMATASDSNMVDSGSDLSVTLKGSACGSMSSTYGYCMGGHLSTRGDVIDKWPFASSSTATDVGNLIIATEAVLYSGCQI